jgi:hypothetical protein
MAERILVDLRRRYPNKRKIPGVNGEHVWHGSSLEDARRDLIQLRTSSELGPMKSARRCSLSNGSAEVLDITSRFEDEGLIESAASVETHHSLLAEREPGSASSQRPGGGNISPHQMCASHGAREYGGPSWQRGRRQRCLTASSVWRASSDEALRCDRRMAMCPDTCTASGARSTADACAGLANGPQQGQLACRANKQSRATD